MARRFRPKKNVVVGIDVSKDVQDCCCLPQAERRSFESTGLEECVAWVVEQRPSLVVMEASGGYERDLWEALEKAGVAVALVNPRAVRDFAKSHGQFAKNDRIDAELLARFGLSHRPRVTKVASNRDLRDLLGYRAALLGTVVAQKNRRKQMRNKLVIAEIDKHLQCLAEQQSTVEDAIAEALRANQLDQERVAILDSAPGVGPTTAAALVILLPELGTLCRRKLAKLVGLAPFTRESGQWKGRRFIGYGRSAVRAALYMPTVVATKHNPVIRDYYARLLKDGKPKMVALVACMRKLLTRLNAMIQRKAMWSDSLIVA